MARLSWRVGYVKALHRVRRGKGPATSVVELSIDTIEAVIAVNSIVLVDFDSPRSATSAEFAPVYAASARLHPEVVHATVEVDAQERLVEIAEVQTMPTMLVFRDGVLVLREAGALSGVVLEELIRQVKLVDMDAVRAAIAPGQHPTGARRTAREERASETDTPGALTYD